MPDFIGYWSKLPRKKKIYAAAGGGFLLLILTAGYFIGRSTPGIETAARQTAELADNIRRHYSQKPGYWGLNTASVLKDGIAPQGMTTEGKLLNALGLPVSVGAGFEGGIIMPGIRSFDIAFAGLSAAECRELAVYSFSDRQNLGLISVSIKNNSRTETFSWGGENPLPVNPDRAKALCRKGGGVLWRFE